ncbi:MAG TPA: ABC transporter permease [Candidatus Polarisedimenticolaceae bacterium]
MRPERRSRRRLAAGTVLLGALAAFAALGPWLLDDPDAIALNAALAAPSSAHWLGTDGLGRDVAARLAHGGRVSLSVGLSAATLVLAIGVPLGAWAGWKGGAVDAVISRAIEAVSCLPMLVLALALLAVTPRALRELPDALRLALVLGVLGWPVPARFVRAEVLKLRDSSPVTAARAAGAAGSRLLVRHVLPGASGPVLVAAAFTVGGAIVAEASLSFLGLGVAPPNASWGSLLAEARIHVERAWWLAVFPGLTLFATVLACNLLADGIRGGLDPRGDLR